MDGWKGPSRLFHSFQAVFQGISPSHSQAELCTDWNLNLSGYNWWVSIHVWWESSNVLSLLSISDHAFYRSFANIANSASLLLLNWIIQGFPPLFSVMDSHHVRFTKGMILCPMETSTTRSRLCVAIFLQNENVFTNVFIALRFIPFTKGKQSYKII